jgi:hypothetical protein
MPNRDHLVLETREPKVRGSRFTEHSVSPRLPCPGHFFTSAAPPNRGWDFFTD